VLTIASASGPLPHLLLEAAAYFVAARVYWRGTRSADDMALQPPPRDRFLLLACALFGAAIGSKTLHVLEHLPALREQQTLAMWLGGKSVLGGFLGGTAGVEIGKRLIRWHAPTGDAWVAPIAVGLVIGRVGCQLSGLWDQTYGNPTALPWGWDYGDGLPRHPVAGYEIVLVLVWYLAVRTRWRTHAGARFAGLLLGYCVIRFGLEFLKPPFGPLAPGTVPVALYGALTAIQWAAIAGTLWFARLLQRRLQAVRPAPTARPVH
jgi:phosphatidylglycerol---prolipoprotein diacylglyceryl transferase